MLRAFATTERAALALLDPLVYVTVLTEDLTILLRVETSVEKMLDMDDCLAQKQLKLVF